MKKILLFGGSFDPPHNGHINNLKNTMDFVRPDKVLVIPSAIPPHKMKSTTDASIRVKMSECFLKLSDNISINTMEIERGGTSFTIDTLESLKKEYLDSEFYLVVGGDMLLYFKKWCRYTDILKLATIVCQLREYDEKADVQTIAKELCDEGGKVLICYGDILPLSSTDVREKVKNGEDITTLVPENVYKIIEENSLYI